MTLSVSLHHRFGTFTLDATFDAPPGVTALFGRSGSGKSTVVNAVAGLLHPDRGRISIDGTALLDTETRLNLPPHKRRMGYVFQDARLFPHLTVRQNLAYGQWFAPNSRATDLPRIADLLGLGPLLPRRPGTLSGGEKQRVAIGRAILSNPRCLLMDEPLAALDEPRKAEILPYLERLRDELALPILYVSHSVAEVARLATTLVLLDAGRVVAAGPAAEVMTDPAVVPVMGLREAGAVISARLVDHETDGLSRLETQGGPIWLPHLPGQTGASFRLRILAQDVMLATSRPRDISALNVLQATIDDLHLGDGPGALIRLRMGEEILLARVTRRSVQGLNLSPGVPVFAILKAVSVAQESIGGAA